MEIIKKKVAIACGLNKYFTGKPCKHGHVSERYVSSSACVECYKTGPMRETMRKCQKEWHLNNREKESARRAKWYEDNSEKTKAWVAANRDKCRSYYTKRRAKKLKATPSWASKETIMLFYAMAMHRTEETGEQYQVDHIVPLQGETVCGLHCQDNLQVITMRENVRKSNRLLEGCMWQQ